MSSSEIGQSKREGRSLYQDKRRGRSRSPSAYLKKKGRRLSDLLSATSLKTLVPKRADEFLGSNSSSSPKRTASMSSFTSFSSPDVPDATLTKTNPSKEETHECPQLLVDIPKDTLSREGDQPTEGSTEDESDVSQPSETNPVDDETLVVPIATAEKHSDVLTSVSGSLNITNVIPEVESIPCDTQVNDVVKDLLPKTCEEEKVSEMTIMETISTVNEDATGNTSSDKELIMESTTPVISISQASMENEVVHPEVVEVVSTTELNNKSVQEICHLKTLESTIVPNDLMKATEETDVPTEANMQTPFNESKGFSRLVVQIVLLLAVICVTIALWMAFKDYVRRNELSQSDIDNHKVLSQLMYVNPKSSTQVSSSKWHKVFSNAKRWVHDVPKIIGKSLDLKPLANTKKPVFSLEDSIDLGQKLRIRAWVARLPHIIDTVKVAVLRK